MIHDKIIKLTIDKNGVILYYSLKPSDILEQNSDYIRFVDRSGFVKEYSRRTIISIEEVAA